MKRVCVLITVIMLLREICAGATGATGAIGDTAKSVCMLNSVTGEIVFEKNSREKLPMASTTKIMTLLVALEETEQDELVTVSRKAAYTEGSSAYLSEGAVVTMKNLEYGLMLNSGNDAAVAIAECVGGSCEEFAGKMNKLAAKLGAKDTNFMNPNGLEDENHYTTAYDLAKITQYAMTKPEFREIVSTRLYKAEYTKADGEHFELEYINHNRLLGELEGCEGVKTGFTSEAGRCLVSDVKRGDAEYITVTLNDSNDWSDHKELYALAFDGCRLVRAISRGECLEHLVSGSKGCDLIAANDFNVPLNGSERRNIDIEPHLPILNDTPLNAGEKVGYVDVLCNGVRVGTVDIIAKTDFNAGSDARVKPCFLFTIINMIKNIL